MIRKFVLATAAVVALGAASLTASTPAAAGGKGGGFHHHHHHGFGWRGGYALYGVGYDSCYRNVWRMNRFGEPVLRTINVCAY
jgi:hypothetical protein